MKQVRSRPRRPTTSSQSRARKLAFEQMEDRQLLAFCDGATFCDQFNRPDGPIGNGWSVATGSDFAMQIRNGEVVNESNSGMDLLSGIVQPIAASGTIRIEATLKEMSATDVAGRFFGTLLAYSDGSVNHGYGIFVLRSSAQYNNSAVWLVDDGSVLGMVNSPFQFGSQVSVDFTIGVDGSIEGNVSGFTFNFPQRARSASGTSFQFVTPGNDPRNTTLDIPPRMDDLRVTVNNVVTDLLGTVVPKALQLFPGQTLSTDLTLQTPAGSERTAVTVQYYLSQNGNASIPPSDEDEHVGSESVILTAGTTRLTTNKVAIPDKIFNKQSLDTWYLKVVLDATNLLNEGEIGETNNVLVSKPLHTTGDRDGFKTESQRSRYESSVTTAKASPDFTVAKAAAEAIQHSRCGLSGTDGFAYTLCNEGFVPQIYIDTAGVPTIGFGYALRKDIKKYAMDRISEAQLIIDPATQFPLPTVPGEIVAAVGIVPGVPITGKQFWELRDRFEKLCNWTWDDDSKKTNGACNPKDGLALPKDQFGNAALGINLVSLGPMDFQQTAKTWAMDDYDSAENELTEYVRKDVAEAGVILENYELKVALIDVVYNIGLKKFTDEFSNFWWALKQYAITGDNRYRAAAGYHLLDSKLADQVKDRSVRNFRLIVHGAEDTL